MNGRSVGWRPKSANLDIASARIRCLNPMNELRRQGYPVELFDPARADAYGVVVYSKLYDDASHAQAEALKRRGARIVVDLCDNHFYNPRQDPEWSGYGARLRRMLSLADQVVVSTAALAEVVELEVPGLRPSVIIGDALEAEIRGRPQSPWKRMRRSLAARLLLRRLAADRARGRTPLVWFGHHGSPYAEGGMLDLLRIAPVLEEAGRRGRASLTVISNSRDKFDAHLRDLALEARYADWSWGTFATLLQAHAIALLPITPNPYTWCKSNNRLALALWNGLAVVADPIPSYRDFAAACWLDGFEAGLDRYLADPGLRRRHVEAGRAMVRERHTIELIARQWRDLFATLLG